MQLRKQVGFERDDLAALIGLTPSELGYLERGESHTRTEVLERIAVALDVDAADLLTFPWGNEDDDDGGEVPVRQYARELLRLVPDSKRAALVKLMRDFVERHTPVLNLLSRKRAR